jgi:hypothetical protein
MEGKYSAADKNISQKSYNKVLALLLLNQLDAARKVSASLTETAELAYLNAIIEARSGANADAVVAKLKTATTKNANLKEKASKDREFIKIMNEASFIDFIK